MIVLLGANGNITSKAARRLLAAGERVRVIGRNVERLAPLRGAGADVAAGDVADTRFLAQALRGASAIYTMLPSDYAAPDPRAAGARVGAAIAAAVAQSGVRRVVNLSSAGAHLASGTGPIAGLHDQEARLDALAGVGTLHLRPGFFFENHLAAIDTIRAVGVYADMIAADQPIPSIATADIAAVVARELGAAQPRTGVLHLRSRQAPTQRQVAATLGAAIGRPDLPYVQTDPAQIKAALVQQGVSPAMADLLEEMAAAFGKPEFLAGIEAGPTELTPTTLDMFAPTFAAAYAGAPLPG